MIRYVTGDILLSKATVIAHGVAPNDDFGQGLALSLREHAPAMYKDFRHYCQSTHPKPGTLWAWAGTGGERIVALFTQEGAYGHGAKPGRATIAHVNHALRELAHAATKEGWTHIALPRLATGVGGLDWSEVKPLVEQHLSLPGVTVEVYETYHKGVAA